MICELAGVPKNDSLFIFDEKTYILAHTLHGFF